VNIFQHDFGYSWPWTLGHVIAAVVFGAVTIPEWRLRD
jgi:hypothetical protein